MGRIVRSSSSPSDTALYIFDTFTAEPPAKTKDTPRSRGLSQRRPFGPLLGCIPAKTQHALSRRLRPSVCLSKVSTCLDRCPDRRLTYTWKPCIVLYGTPLTRTRIMKIWIFRETRVGNYSMHLISRISITWPRNYSAIRTYYTPLLICWPTSISLLNVLT